MRGVRPHRAPLAVVGNRGSRAQPLVDVDEGEVDGVEENEEDPAIA